MKSKKLKSYDSFAKEYIKERFESEKMSHLPSFNKSDDNIKNILNTEYEEVDKDMIISTEEEEKEVYNTDFPKVIGHVEILTQIEYTPPVSEPLEISDTVDMGMFDPSKMNIDNTEELCCVDVLDSPKIFSVVKIMTQNGEKVGMCYTEEVGEYGTPIHNNLDFNNACDLVKTCSSECCLDEFNSSNDKIVGIIPMFMIPKKSKLGNTSYRPN